MKHLLKEKRGNALPLACAIVMALILLFSVVSEYMRLQIIAKGVRNAVQTSVIMVSSENYDEVYNGLREGYSGGYTLSSNDIWKSNLNTGDVYAYLDNLLGLEKRGTYHTRFIGKEIEYELSNMKIIIKNTPLAPSNPNNLSKFQVEIVVHLEVPLSFGWDKLPPIQVNLRVKSGYTSKF